MDTAAARVRVGLSAKPAVIDDLERRLENLQTEKAAKERDQRERVADHQGRLAELDELIAQTTKDLDQYVERWNKEKEAVDSYIEARDQPADEENGNAAADSSVADAIAKVRELQGHDPLVPVHVDQAVAAQVIADWTGIPVGNMVEEELAKLSELEDRLRGRVRGQDHALRTLADTIRINKAGLGNPTAPIGVFLLVGPSGTGKTESGLTLADVLFGGERFLTTINMSEFKEEYAISLLIGSPPGYVGYGEGGVLTEAVRQRPYSVVLVDEVEKASPEIMDLFYHIFDKGYCEDRTGRAINFRNSIILMTSNLGSQQITDMCSTEPWPEPEELAEAIEPALQDRFKAALRGRFRVIPFYPLSHSVLREVAELKLDRLSKRFRDVHGINMEFDESLLDHLAARCQATELGARQLDHHISQEILPRLAGDLLRRLGEEKTPQAVRLSLDETGAYSFSLT